MRLEFSSEADVEIDDAITFYEFKEPGLGDEFASELDVSLARILEFPLSAPVLRGEIRRCNVPRFPYAVLYAVLDD